MDSTMVAEAARAISRHIAFRPRIGLILGTGLGNLVSELHVRAEVPYASIPYFPRSTAMAHKGILLGGELAGVPAVVMAGRCHLYEGYSPAEVALPVRVLHKLGIEVLVVTNAAGGLNPRFCVGDVMVLVDHVNLMFCPGTAGQRQEPGETLQSPLWPRRPPYYDPDLVDQACCTARRGNFNLHCGVYVGVKGPNYETRAEYRAFRRLGGDVVGMSTIPEVLCARSLSIRVAAFSAVTNIARPDAPQIVTPDDVVAMSAQAEPKIRQIVMGIAASQV